MTAALPGGRRPTPPTSRRSRTIPRAAPAPAPPMQAPPPPTGAAPAGTRLTIARPDDWHLHVRDGAGLKAVVPASARVFGRAVIMPNTVPPITTVDMVGAAWVGGVWRVGLGARRRLHRSRRRPEPTPADRARPSRTAPASLRLPPKAPASSPAWRCT